MLIRRLKDTSRKQPAYTPGLPSEYVAVEGTVPRFPGSKSRRPTDQFIQFFGEIVADQRFAITMTLSNTAIQNWGSDRTAL